MITMTIEGRQNFIKDEERGGETPLVQGKQIHRSPTMKVSILSTSHFRADKHQLEGRKKNEIYHPYF